MITDELQSIIAAEVSRQVRASRMNDGSGPLRVDPYNIPFQNISGEVVPPYAVMRPDGGEVRSGNWVFKMTKPDDTFSRRYYINGPYAIPDDGFGDCSDGTYPTMVRFPGTGTFTNGKTNFGIASGSWDLKKGGVGRFRYCFGANYQQGVTYPGAVSFFQQADCEALIVQSISTVSPGDYTTFNVHDIDGETSIQIQARCMIYPPGIGGDGSPGGYTTTWPDDTVFGAHFYGIYSVNHANDWRLAWGYSPGTLI